MEQGGCECRVTLVARICSSFLGRYLMLDGTGNMSEKIFGVVNGF